MKNWKKGVALACAGVMSVSLLASCKPDDQTSVDPTTINVELFKGSYGVNWVYTLVEKFEALYEKEGYKVNVLKPSSDMRNNVAINQLALGYAETNVDMYISGGLSASKIGEQGEYGVLCEEISDVWEMKPIGFDGTEETVTLGDKVVDGIYETYVDAYGKVYGVPYMTTTGGMVVNKRKLALYGITDMPTTTNELFEVWDKIYQGANGMQNSEVTQLFPFTYMPGTANGYTIDWFVSLMAQYDQVKSDEFWSWQTQNADGTQTWWEGDVTAAAETPGFLAALEVFARAFDINVAAYGTSTQTLDQAQAQIMKQNTGAIFMCNGSWYLNDMALGYKNSLDDITFINFPVVSALADKIWADTVTDAAKREEMLRYAIDQVDDLTKAANPAAIAADMTTKYSTEVTEEDVIEVRRARYVYSNRTSGHEVVITKDSTKRDICELFIRMMASDDATAMIAEQANANSAYILTPNTTHKYEFVQAASRIAATPYAYACSNTATGYKYVLGRTSSSPTLSVGHIAAHIAGLADSLSIYNGEGGLSGNPVSVYADLAKTIQEKEIKFYQDNISNWETTNSERIEVYRELWQPVK